MISAADDARARLHRVREQIAAACARAGRHPSQVQLVGVSKRQPAERIALAVRAGVEMLGENFVQEVRDKQPLVHGLVADPLALPDGPSQGAAAMPRWRMIGRLQRNKAKLAVDLFDAIDSVDRLSLATELDRRARAAGKSLDICLQVDLSGEDQKGGAAPDAVGELLAACAELASLRVVGLMAIPAATSDPETTRPLFARLRELRDCLSAAPGGERLRELSMGMSSDFEIAVEEGATLVRVGTALFGPRPS